MNPETFIQRWAASSGSERANYQGFVRDLCQLLGVPEPEPATGDPRRDGYTFERPVSVDQASGDSTTNFIDLYRRGSFVLEAKQGSDRAEAEGLFGPVSVAPARRGTATRGTGGWDKAMLAARNQAERYAHNLPSDERPPFLVVVDVGYSIELYSEFTRTGRTYKPFPDPQNHRIFLQDLAKPEVLELLRRVWLEPLSLDPSKRSAKVTREIADKLAQLARSLERDHSPERVAAFLMRCIFTMFAEDMGLLPKDKFKELLESLRGDEAKVVPMLESLWATMDKGGFSPILREQVLQFNGGLFADPTALPLTRPQLELLVEAAGAEWRDVEPAIFGTLLERALDERERHKLGAHYTPRAYVERLVEPTLIEPLEAEWRDVQTEIALYQSQGEPGKAVERVEEFHRHLCGLRILDPACGSGNFLYVALELMKRLEGEVFDTLARLGREDVRLDLKGITVDPHQFLGLEVNPRAAKIAELVLWIGYLQWHYRTRGNVAPPAPILRDFHNIECRDAVLEYDRTEKALDEQGKPVTRWDGHSYKRHPVTGEDVPDETKRVQELRYLNPRKAEWPEADYIVGNPPFIGAGPMRATLGDGYAKALRATHDDVPESADFVMYWWNQAAHLLRAGKVRRFGLIATNSLRQTFNRRVLQAHLEAKNPLSLTFAIPDHPWGTAPDGAAVRISMTVGQAGTLEGLLQKVASEWPDETGEAQVRLDGKTGKIQADLTIGANVVGAGPLRANENLSSRGVQLIGGGFMVTPDEAREKLGLGRVAGLERHVRLYRNGKDLTATPRDVKVIDLFGLSLEEVRTRLPETYQWVLERVKPERDQNNRAAYRENWWIHGEPRGNFRPALDGLSRYIATVETSKHRFFVLLDKEILPDNMLVNFAFDDAYYLGVLSSRTHVVWALAAGGTLEDRPRYNKTRCFEPFPFPDASEPQKAEIRRIAEALDAHRKERQALHPGLTLTGMYNVLEKLRAGDALNEADRRIHQDGLISVLRQLHDELDSAVAVAYGWPVSLSDEEILERLVALNTERAAEEKSGTVRWLRPEYQAKGQAVQTQELGLEAEGGGDVVAEKLKFPSALKDQIGAIRNALRTLGRPATPAEVARTFKGAREPRVRELLDTLASLSQAQADGGRFGL